MAEDAEAEDSELGGFGDGMLSQEALDALIAESALKGGVEDEPEAWPGSVHDEPETPQDVSEATFSAPSHSEPAENIGMVDLPSFDSPAAGAAYGGPEPVGMGRVRDIPLEVTVELGRTRLLIRDILDLSSGSIIELDKIAGEPVDLFANGMLVARGEVIVIDDNFGVRVTEIITAADRSAPEKDTHAFAA